MGNEQTMPSDGTKMCSHHSKSSTKLKKGNKNGHWMDEREYSVSKSKSFSKSKSKTRTNTRSRSRSKSKSRATLGLPSLHNNHSNSFTPSSLVSKHLPSAEAGHVGSPKSPQSPHTEVQNGITGSIISTRVVRIAARFWEEHIAHKSLEDKLEFGCAIYFGMLTHNSEMKAIFSKNLTSKSSIENSSVKFLDMMGWLLRSLLSSDTNVLEMLQRLGEIHRKMGVHYQHFDPMLQSMHETFSYYFPIKYGIQIKYAIDQIFTVAARVMSGEDLSVDSNKYYHLKEIQESLDEHTFLKSLPECLESNVGREYLYRYLQQTFCDEIAIFLQGLSKFKSATSDKERFMIARHIVKSSIEPTAMFSINISYEQRTNSLADMAVLETMFFEKDDLKVSKDLFINAEKEIHKLISNNHWLRFNQMFKNIDSSPRSTPM